MDAIALRHFKDFLQIYNKITENCFVHCALLQTDRDTSPVEMKCVDRCAQKHIHVNHKIMKLYMDIQPEFLKMKMQEAEKLRQEMSESEKSTEQPN